MKYIVLASLLLFAGCLTKETPPPTPLLPLPDENQLAWHDMEMNALFQTFKETRRQLTKDVRYLKVMKPKSLVASSQSVVYEEDGQNDQEAKERSNNKNKNKNKKKTRTRK